MIKQILLLILTFPTLATAHGGGTDKNGCHNDRVGDRGYHCHNKKEEPEPITPDPSPKPTKVPTGTYPVPPQSTQVLSDTVQYETTVYSPNKISLPCIYFNNQFYNADLVPSSTGFIATNVKQTNACDTVSSEYSELTQLLTIFDVSVASAHYKASLERKNGRFQLVYLHEQEEHVATTDYDREEWGTRWGRQYTGCSNTRYEVLNNYDKNAINGTCNISTGLWLDPYTDATFSDSGELDVDHIVPVAYAHKHGGAYWSAELKDIFYNDLENLLPVSASSNRQKGSKPPSEWMPDNINYHCQYVDTFLYIVDKYALDLLSIERSNISQQCTH